MAAKLADHPDALSDALVTGKIEDGPLLIRVPVGTVSPATRFSLKILSYFVRISAGG
jgi:hypothetical protein